MPAKGGNTKKESGRAKKAENENKKAAESTAKAEAADAADWDQGARGKSTADSRAEKAAEAARKKAEKQKLLEEDEANTPSKVPKAGKKAGGAASKKSGGGGGGGIDDAIASFSAGTLDDALDAMTLVNERTDDASKGAAAGLIERHPERRFKAAFEAFKERELPKLKEEHKGLRLQQYHDLLFKQFQKHPDNPFNQISVSHNASKDEKLSVLQAKRDANEKRLRDA